jgi:hypothetical protein
MVRASEISKMIGYFIPDYELEFIAIILHALPKQIYYQLKLVDVINDKEK